MQCGRVGGSGGGGGEVGGRAMVSQATRKVRRNKYWVLHRSANGADDWRDPQKVVFATYFSSINL